MGGNKLTRWNVSSRRSSYTVTMESHDARAADGRLTPLAIVSGEGEQVLPPAWREFIRYCRDLRHGEIERLSIQDGLPVLAEITKKKIRFTR